MDFLERFNTKFGAWYEGLFVGGELRPKDVLRRITQAMEAGRTEGVDGKPYVPNAFTLELATPNAEERAALLTFLDANELASVLQIFLTEHGYHTRGPLAFTITDAPAEGLEGRRDRLRVRARFEKDAAPPGILPEPEPAAAPPEADPPTVAAPFPHEDDPPTVAAAFPASLLVTGPGGAAERFPLHKPVVTIGRSRRSGNDLVLEHDDQASKTHARLERETDGRWTLYDLNSTNGVSVNGQRIAGNRALQDGDTLTIGTTTLRLNTGEPAPAPRPAPETRAPEPGLPRRARLVTIDGQEHVLASETLIGRAVTSDIVLPDPAVSTRHARIVAPDWATYYLEDLGSTTGTELNGRQLQPQSRALLADGDTLRLGTTVLRFQSGTRP